MTGQAHIVQADALRLPLPDGSVDLIVTSPPYAFLRAYDTGYPHLEVGAEATPAEFLEHLWQATAEMVRVLKPTGSIFVDLGDKYGRPGGGVDVNPRSLAGVGNGYLQRVKTPTDGGGRDKSLMLLPERYRIGAVDQLGLIARAVICWSKPNGLPESVNDRVRRSHEDWVHLTRQPRYYSAIDEVREAYSPQTAAWQRLKTRRAGEDHKQAYLGMGHGGLQDGRNTAENPLGKLPGSVWTIPSEPLRLPDHLGVQHYAAFPSEWPRRLILGWSPPGICLDCGQGRVPVVERRYVDAGGKSNGERYDRDSNLVSGGSETALARGRAKPQEMPYGRANAEATILGYACACNEPIATPLGNGHGEDPTLREGKAGFKRPRALDAGTRVITRWDQRHHAAQIRASSRRREMEADLGRPLDHYMKPSASSGRPLPPDVLERWLAWGWLQPAPPFELPPTRPAVVLDPFSGTGTTPMVARALGRIGVGVDLSMPYSRAARWRVKNDAAKAISRTWTERQGSLL